MTLMNLVTLEAGAEYELWFNEPVSAVVVLTVLAQ
jgi:hypothetical protein